MAQCECVSRAARKENFIARHPTAYLRQPDRVGGLPRGVNRITDRQFGIVGNDLGGLGEGLFKWVGWVV